MKRRTPIRRRGFTLVELIVAGLLTAMLLGTISVTLGQLARAKSTCKERLDAHLRADLALNTIRRDLASLIRSEDLFYCQFMLTDQYVGSPDGDLDRDELLIFNTRFRAIRDIDFNGEGSEFETQYRVGEEGGSTMLWVRRDAFPDKYPTGGGLATPLVRNIISFNIEAFDGDKWWDNWDSDWDGLPHAIRITVIGSGARPEQDPEDAVVSVMRTVVAVDRVVPPADRYRIPEEDLEEADLRVLIDPKIRQDPNNPGGNGAGSGLGSTAGAGGAGLGGDGRGGGEGGGGRGGEEIRGGEGGGRGGDDAPPRGGGGGPGTGTGRDDT
jgi:type II secretory pathway pseudopilin PulG